MAGNRRRKFRKPQDRFGARSHMGSSSFGTRAQKTFYNKTFGQFVNSLTQYVPSIYQLRRFGSVQDLATDPINRPDLYAVFDEYVQQMDLKSGAPYTRVKLDLTEKAFKRAVEFHQKHYGKVRDQVDQLINRNFSNKLLSDYSRKIELRGKRWRSRAYNEIRWGSKFGLPHKETQRIIDTLMSLTNHINNWQLQSRIKKIVHRINTFIKSDIMTTIIQRSDKTIDYTALSRQVEKIGLELNNLDLSKTAPQQATQQINAVLQETLQSVRKYIAPNPDILDQLNQKVKDIQKEFDNINDDVIKAQRQAATQISTLNTELQSVLQLNPSEQNSIGNPSYLQSKYNNLIKHLETKMKQYNPHFSWSDYPELSKALRDYTKLDLHQQWTSNIIKQTLGVNTSIEDETYNLTKTIKSKFNPTVTTYDPASGLLKKQIQPIRTLSWDRKRIEMGFNPIIESHRRPPRRRIHINNRWLEQYNRKFQIQRQSNQLRKQYKRQTVELRTQLFQLNNPNYRSPDDLIDSVIHRQQLKIGRRLGAVGERYMKLGSVMEKAIPTLPTTQTSIVVKNIIKKFKREFNLSDGDFKIGTDKGDLVLQINSENMYKQVLGEALDEEFTMPRTHDITIKIPNFRGNFYMKHDRLYVGSGAVELIRSHKKVRLLSFGDRIQNNILNDEFLSNLKKQIRLTMLDSKDPARYNETIREVMHNVNYIINNRIEQITDLGKDVHNDSVQETILKASKVVDERMEHLFSGEYGKYLDKQIIETGGKLSNGALYKYVEVLRRSGYNVSVEDVKGIILNRLRRLKQQRGKTVHGTRTIDMVDAYVKDMQDIQEILVAKNGVMQAFNPAGNTKYIPDPFSVQITKLMRGELNLFDVTEVKMDLAFPYAKGPKPMFRPYQNAFGLIYGDYYKQNRNVDNLANGDFFRMQTTEMSKIESAFFNNDAEVMGHVLINIDDNLLTSTEGNLLLTETLGKKIMPMELNASQKLNQTQFRQLLRDLKKQAGGDLQMQAMINELEQAFKNKKGSYNSSKEILLNVLDAKPTKTRKSSKLAQVGVSRRVGNLLRKMNAIRRQDKRAEDIFVKQFIYNPDGSITVVYDAPHKLGPQSKIFTMHTKGVHNGIRLISPDGVQNIIKSYTGKVVDKEVAQSVDAIISSKAWEKQHYAPIAQGLMVETTEKVITKIAKEYQLSKDDVTELANQVIYSYLDVIDPNLKDQTEFFKDVLPMTKEGKRINVGAGPSLKFDRVGRNSIHHVRVQWHDTAFARLNQILNVNRGADVLMETLKKESALPNIKKALAKRIRKVMKDTDYSEKKVKELVDKIFNEMVFYDSSGNMRQLLVKSFVTVTKENPFELYKIAQNNGHKFRGISDGIKLGVNEYLALKAIGLDEDARSVLSLKAMGKDYVENYYVTLLRMLGFDDRDIEQMAPNYFKRKKGGEYIRDQAKVVDYQQIKQIRNLLKEKEGNEHMGMFRWVRPGLEPADIYDPETGMWRGGKVGVAKKEDAQLIEAIEEAINNAAQSSHPEAAEEFKEVVKRARQDGINSVLLSDKEYHSLKKFLRSYNTLRLDGTYVLGDTEVGEIKLMGIERTVKEIPLVRNVMDDMDAIRIRVPVTSPSGATRLENRWVLNDTLTEMVKLMRQTMIGEYSVEDISATVNKYYANLLNHSIKSIGTPIQAPSMMQIGMPKLILDKRKDLDAVLNAMGKQTRPGMAFMNKQVGALHGNVGGVYQIYPDAGEVIISKKSFIKMLKARGDMKDEEILKLAADVMEGKKNFMGNLVRYPTKDHKSILPVSFRLIDTDKIEDKQLRERLQDAMIINAIDGVTLSGDWDKDIYFLTTLVAENKDKQLMDQIVTSFSDLSYKINKNGADFDTQYVPTGRRSKALLDSFKEVQGMIGPKFKKEELVDALHQGARITPDSIRDAIKKLSTRELSDKEIDEMTNKIMGRLKERFGEDDIDKYYMLSMTEPLQKSATTALHHLQKVDAQTRALFGTENQSFVMDLVRKTYKAAGLKGDQLDEALYSIRVAKAMNVTSFITVKALTGEIYNFTHNKIWNAAADAANQAFGVDSEKAKSIMRLMQEYAGQPTQSNISSKHLFPTIAPDVIKTFREYALGTKEEKLRAFEKIKTGDFEGIISQELTDSILDLAKQKHKLNKNDAEFIDSLTKRIQTNKQIINGKEVYIENPTTMKLSELARLGDVVEKNQVEMSEVKLDAIKTTAQLASKEKNKLKPLEEHLKVLTDDKFRHSLAERFRRKAPVEAALVKTYKHMPDTQSASQFAIQLSSLTREEVERNPANQFLLAATGRHNSIVAPELPKQFHNKVNLDSVGRSIRDKFSDLVKRWAKEIEGDNANPTNHSHNGVKRSGIGLLLGSAAIGYLAYQALRPDDTNDWLGITHTDSDGYDYKFAKSDKHAYEQTMLKSANMPSDMDLLSVPGSLNKKTARIMLNRLRNSRMSYEENLSAQYQNTATLNRSPRSSRQLNAHGTLFARAVAITQRR